MAGSARRDPAASDATALENLTWPDVDEGADTGVEAGIAGRGNVADASGVAANGTVRVTEDVDGRGNATDATGIGGIGAPPIGPCDPGGENRGGGPIVGFSRIRRERASRYSWVPHS